VFATTAVERSETPFGKDRAERLFSPKRTDLLLTSQTAALAPALAALGPFRNRARQTPQRTGRLLRIDRPLADVPRAFEAFMTRVDNSNQEKNENRMLIFYPQLILNFPRRHPQSLPYFSQLLELHKESKANSRELPGELV
jgi:hypothetical protein